MIEWVKLTSEEIPAIDKRLPVIIPLGLVEAHGPHLPLSVDIDCGEYFARRIASEAGAILAPMLPYGFADEMREYPGTVGVTAETLALVITDLAEMFCFHGFTRQIFFSGHGGNQRPVEMAFYRVWKNYRDFKPVYWNYWSAANFNNVHHADKEETEIALAVGIPAKLDLARDSNVNKPWHRIRSRFAIDPASGGVNGKPSLADPKNGERVRDEIVRVLVSKVRAIIDAEQQGCTR
jgi:creatinine amidohydrolase